MQETGSGYHAAGDERDHRYKMIADPRGPCLIFNNKTFTAANGAPIPDLPTREGTDIDRDKLSTVFSTLKFDVQCYENVTSTQMFRILTRVADDDNQNKDFDCFVCCILSHGDEGHVYGTDGVSIRIQQLVDRVSRHCSPEFAGKPKLFFIQACQGEYVQGGRPVHESDSAPDMQRFIPENTDFLIAHSTLPGYKAFRDPANGSLFIDKLTEVLSSEAHRRDIVKMLTMVNDKLADVDVTSPGYRGISKQASVFQSSLRKDLYFYPDQITYRPTVTETGPVETCKVSRPIDYRCDDLSAIPVARPEYSETGRVETCQVSRPTDYRCDDLSAGPVARPEYSGSTMQVYVSTLTGQPFTLTVEESETIRGVKSKIHHQEGTPPSQQRLIYGAKQLKDECTLKDYNIENEATLRLAVRRPGSSTANSSIESGPTEARRSTSKTP